jgi:hypothetical protein
MTKEALSMRISRSMTAAALAVALVFSSASIVLAAPRRPVPKPKPAYRITKPHVASAKVTVGVAFDATGVVMPTITSDDTTVVIEVRRLYGTHMGGVLMRVPAVLSSAATTGTLYTASVKLTSSGEFALAAVVRHDGKTVMRTTGRPVRAVLPYRVTKPRVLHARVVAGASFVATGVVIPGIDPADLTTTVSVVTYKVGRRGKLTKVARFDAVNTGAAGTGSGYSASVSLPSAGRYVLVGVVMRDGIVLGRSTQRPMLVRAAPVV